MERYRGFINIERMGGHIEKCPVWHVEKCLVFGRKIDNVEFKDICSKHNYDKK